ncbi:MAG: hypothetical protein JW867_05820 [Candidatus Omnitrophica bacterium]|nr:hypothetical protein [Candidatus Omnitrophota bacterium]
MKKLIYAVFALVLLSAALITYNYVSGKVKENKILKEFVANLEAESRVAEVLVTNVKYDEQSKKTFTTIKFLEFGLKGKPLEPRYFTFPGNIIQFQSLVIRFDDEYVKTKHPLKEKSIYLFWKVFMLDGPNTLEYDITKVNEIPSGYKIESMDNYYQKKLWQEFWKYAIDSQAAQGKGIKNAQIEAPGTMFAPGTLYTVKIEHDGGLRIDAKKLPEILKGEYIPKDKE